MPQDDHKPVHGDNKAQNADNGLKQPGKQHEKQPDSGDYASKMWHKIEGAVAKDKISGLKQELGDKPQEVPGEHKKRHRSRGRGKGHGGEAPRSVMGAGKPEVNQQPIHKSQHQDVQVKQSVELKQQVPSFAPVSTTAHIAKHEKIPQISKTHPVAPISPFAQTEAVPPTPPVEPVSPFGLPPKNYEPKLKQEKAKKEEKEEMAERFDDFTDKASKDDVIPINPFEMEPSAKPLDTKSLDDKPLDRVGKAPKVEAAFYEEVKSPQDRGEANESEVASVKNVINEPTMEDRELNARPKEEIIDVTPESQSVERKIEPVFPENIDNGNGNETGEFKEDFWSILEQAGITKKKAFIILISVVLIIIIGLFFLFGGYKIFQSDGGKVDESSNPEVVISEPDSSEPDVVGLNPYSIISSYIFGLEFKPTITPIEAEPISSFGDSGGVFASFIFGEISDLKAEQFVEYVRLLEKTNNIYNVDVYSLVDLSVDRRKALDDYLKEMDELIQQGMAAFENIEADLLSLDAQYNAVTLQNEQYEAAFFQYLQNFYGQTAYDTLQTFISSSNESGRLKAEYRVKNTLRTMFVNSLNLLRPKFKDVAANTEALIKGVKVFDVPKSDIDAIIPLE